MKLTDTFERLATWEHFTAWKTFAEAVEAAIPGLSWEVTLRDETLFANTSDMQVFLHVENNHGSDNHEPYVTMTFKDTRPVFTGVIQKSPLEVFTVTMIRQKIHGTTDITTWANITETYPDIDITNPIDIAGWVNALIEVVVNASRWEVVLNTMNNPLAPSTAPPPIGAATITTAATGSDIDNWITNGAIGITNGPP